jgi:hypothetical protein
MGFRIQKLSPVFARECLRECQGNWPFAARVEVFVF